MLVAFGWVHIKPSTSPYHTAEYEKLDNIHDTFMIKSADMFHELEKWLERENDGWLEWLFSQQLNNHSGLLQFHTSRNHRASVVWRLMEFIRHQSLGSHGVVYIHDDEDIDRIKSSDFQSSYRVWRILEGKITEHDDHLFSPFTSKHAFGAMFED